MQGHPIRQRDVHTLHLYDNFFASSEVTYIPVTQKVFDLATEFRAEQNIKTPDALHLATAVVSGCQEFWTNDLKLQKAGSRYLDVVIP
ncbi:MAG: type II toxin-antitoxin system VapC family toxin [bacterium]